MLLFKDEQELHAGTFVHSFASLLLDFSTTDIRFSASQLVETHCLSLKAIILSQTKKTPWGSGVGAPDGAPW